MSFTPQCSPECRSGCKGLCPGLCLSGYRPSLPTQRSKPRFPAALKIQLPGVSTEQSAVCCHTCWFSDTGHSKVMSTSLRACCPPPGQVLRPQPTCAHDGASTSSLLLLSRTGGRNRPGCQGPWPHTEEHPPPAAMRQAKHCCAGDFVRLRGDALPRGGQRTPASVWSPGGTAHRSHGHKRTDVTEGSWSWQGQSLDQFF